MTELHLLRHGDAGDPMAWKGSDAERPLSGKGEKQAERLGRFLKEVGFRPDAIISSPKVRAAQTAEIVAGHLGVPVTTDDRLAGALEIETLVGHDPDFSDLLEALTGASGVTMKKGALARIDIERPFAPGRGSLRWLVPPDLLKADR
jgi:phosphohistidine phosphatase SixA